jgi:predicted phosphoribosyltransferase
MRRIMDRSSSPRLRFQDRRQAGRQLARALATYAGRPDVLVLALPRGGVPVAYEVALALDAPLDVFLVRKLGVPGHEELAFGALASGVRVLNEEVVQCLGIPPRVIARVTAAEREELRRRRRAYRGQRRPPRVRGQIVILVDDGVATGASMRAALSVLRRARPARIVVAVPVAAPGACAAFGAEVEEVICAWTPDPFHTVGHWYEDFAPPSDAEVCELLGGTARPEGALADPRTRSGSPGPSLTSSGLTGPPGRSGGWPNSVPQLGWDQFASGSPPTPSARRAWSLASRPSVSLTISATLRGWGERGATRRRRRRVRSRPPMTSSRMVVSIIPLAP